MAQLLVRDVPQDVVEALKRQAAKHGRSAEAEHRAILEEALRAGRAGFWERAAALREETHGRHLTDSTELIRKDRDFVRGNHPVYDCFYLAVATHREPQ